ncbi:hypothetical protein GCM10007385_35150 [Tateyamaria omphalii]|uniref:hypothetical protein n=1 Tax=Tateyamaria omphalii TaxID=299262 RepID=UPI001675F452|nr:hypothetical protein [Tateyamaria omphalii]GGX62994.1 hypothetical protein GCM10007385_35150 [Tateyamaria omphalii]
MNQLATIEGPKLPEFYGKPGEIERIISEIEKEVESQVSDVTTAKGRKNIASLAHKIARSKTALDKAGKELNDKKRAAINAVDAERRVVRERLDALKATVRKPLDEWEAAEQARIATLKARLSAFAWKDGYRDASSSDLADVIATLDAIPIDDSWDEFQDEAATNKENCLSSLRFSLTSATEREQQAAELERLRAAEAARIAKEQEAKAEAERIEWERSEKERLERERLAQEKAERERTERIERERVEAAEKAKQEAEDQARRDAKEAEERHQRELDEANARAEAAAQAERDRIAAQERVQREAAEKRRRDTEHRDRILSEITAALMPIPREDVAKAMLDGRIPHVEVKL